MGLVRTALVRGPLRWVVRDRVGRVPILRYHAIGAEPCSHNVGLDTWRRHLDEFDRRRVEVVSLRDHFDRPAADPRRRVVMTFDDGFASCRHIALEDLVRRGYTATFFVASRFVGRHPDWLAGDLARLLSSGHGEISGSLEAFLEAAHLDEEYARAHLPVLLRLPRRACLAELYRLDRLRRHRLMTWEEIRALQRAGMEIGAHAAGHGRLDELTQQERRRELAECKNEIESRIGGRVRFFGLGYGRAPVDLAGLLAECGYEGACSCEKGFWRPGCDAFRLPRIDAAALTNDTGLQLVLDRGLRVLADLAWGGR